MSQSDKCNQEEPEGSDEKILPLYPSKENLSEDGCYVLITCSQPNSEGRMKVELEYQGETELASLLVHHAQDYLDDTLSAKENIN